MAICYPTINEIENFRVRLRGGKEFLLQQLRHFLDDSYEIFVQPFLNGDRPDFVIIRRGFGVLIIEVKDWNLNAYRNIEGGLSPWLLKDNTRISSPLAQVQSYKNNFYKLHINLLFEKKIQNISHFSIVQPAVYFHEATQQLVNNYCHGIQYMHLLGRDSVINNGIGDLPPIANLTRRSMLFDDDLYNSFYLFLRPPDHMPDVGKEITYTPRQEELTRSEEGKHQKIKGIAGCGKTQVLARRAVNAYARTNSTVLILTFNITLRNYIHDKVSEVRLNFPWSGFEITNYHQFVRTQANNYNIHYDDLLVAANDETLFTPVINGIKRYEAIFVDEVQDYEYVWLTILIKYFLQETGEFVVFGDEKQNIYGRKMGEDKFPRVPSVPGRWNELNKSFRLDSATLQVAKKFQHKFFYGRYALDEQAEPRQGDLFETPGIIKYRIAIGYSGMNLYNIVREEALFINVHPNNLVVLAPTFKTLRDIEYGFRIVAHERTTHAGETQEEYAKLRQQHINEYEFNRALDEIRHGRKLHFWGNAGTTKFSTIHSFKGWEAHTLILVIADTDGIEARTKLDELIYVAITRVRQNLVVIDTVGTRYRHFFEGLSQ